MTCRGIEGKDSCGKRAIRKSLCSFRLTALCDIIADMRADSPSYLAHFGVEPSTVRGPCWVRVMGSVTDTSRRPCAEAQPTGDGRDRAFSDAAVRSLAAKEVYLMAVCRVLALTMRLAGTPRPRLPQA